jgi:hypothetical protein
MTRQEPVPARSRRRWRTALALFSALLVVAGSIAGVRVLTRTVPSASSTTSVAVQPVPRRAVRVPAARSWVPPRTSWPKAVTGKPAAASAAASASAASSQQSVTIAR